MKLAKPSTVFGSNGEAFHSVSGKSVRKRVASQVWRTGIVCGTRVLAQFFFQKRKYACALLKLAIAQEKQFAVVYEKNTFPDVIWRVQGCCNREEALENWKMGETEQSREKNVQQYLYI